MKMDKHFAEAITAALVDKIKAIESTNWEQPWFDNVALRPKNLDGKQYQGLNRMLLSLLDGGREIPVYMTFLRAKQEGISILTGEKSLPVQYANQVAFDKETKKSIPIEKYESLSESEKANYDVAFMMKHYRVFNVEQTNMKEVKPELYERLKAEVVVEKREIEQIYSPLISMVEKQAWHTPIHQDNITNAYYSPGKDEIHLPAREYFKSDDLYYSTLLHEMSHSTGHESRLDRPIRNEFGSPQYAQEELVAELSAAIVGQQYNVSKQLLDGNAQYLGIWLNRIDKEPEFLNQVLGEVLKASEMITDRVEQVKEQMQSSIDVVQPEAEKKQYSQDLTVNLSMLSYAKVYANESLMTIEGIRQHALDLPLSLRETIEKREQTLKDLEITYSPVQEKDLLECKMRLEDDIRSGIRSFLLDKYNFPLAPHIDYQEKLKSMDKVQAYVLGEPSPQRLLHDGIHSHIPLEITTEDNQEKRTSLAKNDTAYELLPDGKLRYKGIARLQEGYSMEDNKTNRDFLESSDISYASIRGNRLFVSFKATKIALLLASSIALTPIIGVAVLYAMNRANLVDKLLSKGQFSPEEAKLLNQGETLRKETRENGRAVEKYYFVDRETNRLRSIPVQEVHLPSRVNGVQLSVKELDELKMGKKVSGYDEASGLYYQAQLNLNDKRTIEMGFKELKATKEFSYVPKPNSPDQDKIAYVQVHGAQGVNDIWEKGGVNLERDSFLDKYDVEGFYKDYLKASNSDNHAKANELSEAIQQNIRREETIGISR